MRTAAICFLLLLSSVLAFGQEPQWTVVKHLTLTQQNTPIPFTTLLIPEDAGIYRVNISFSGSGTEHVGVWGAQVGGADVSGAQLNLGGEADCNVPNWTPIPSVMVFLKAQVPLVYRVFGRGATPSCQYNLAITVEQLVP
jgi:hypothetical protein